MASSPSSPTILLLLSAAALFSLLTTPASARDRLTAGEFLEPGQSLRQGAYSFIMQHDCNLVLYDNGRAVWATGTNGQASGCELRMQNDGNLVIYSGRRAIWASKTNRQMNFYYVILQRDRNVVIYSIGGYAIWATGTNVGNAAVVVIPHSNGTAAASGAAQNKDLSTQMAGKLIFSLDGNLIVEGINYGNFIQFEMQFEDFKLSVDGEEMIDLSAGIRRNVPLVKITLGSGVDSPIFKMEDDVTPLPIVPFA
ncbi:hypothetical protein IEQ34_005378 [Dendrobium chrysotoxum]|uniref:Bulb-type lectin domain-containing protein n=1 Tax=Dendrobium chrysotoxum TaxID=161865 RepID=A0AAV7HCU5_DENCH|nr:hypothetical protein IEQ34_005378 [Dendrobium chrysotoxum]